MTRHVRTAAALPLLALAAGLTATPSRADPNVQKELLKFLGKAVTAKDAKAFADKNDDMEAVMSIFRKKKQGGLGIEEKIQELDKTKLDDKELAAQRKELARLADISRVVSELSHAYAQSSPAKTKEWQKYAEETAKESKAFAKVVEKGDPAAVQKAARGLNAACIACHKEFK